MPVRIAERGRETLRRLESPLDATGCSAKEKPTGFVEARNGQEAEAPSRAGAPVSSRIIRLTVERSLGRGTTASTMP